MTSHRPTPPSRPRSAPAGLRLRPSLVLFALFATPALANSTCLNYGIVGSSSCACPPGFTGADCSDLACGNPLLSQSSRPVFDIATAGSDGSVGCGSQCTAGFSGPSCNTCTAASACTAASSLNNGGSAFGDVTCSVSGWAWTESFSSCDVISPTLQAAFPGSTYLTFQKTVDPALSLSSTWGSNGTVVAQLWYSSSTGNTSIAEQFFCAADSCIQSNKTTETATEIDWACQNLACTCIPGTLFCGGGGSIDLTDTIDGLSGFLTISCDVAGENCEFQQTVLQTLFGSAGLTLSSCLSGECVRESTIATLAAQLVASVVPGTSFSPGVIGGLSVLAVVVVALALFVVVGWWNQRKARRSYSPLAEDSNGVAVGLRWSNLGYSLKPRRRRGRFGRATEVDGRVLLDGITGEISGGGFLAILGPTGAGKSTLVDILAGRRKSGRKSGTVEFVLPDGASSEKLKIGYVDQADVLPSTSTVREALLFAAKLKLPEGMPLAAKEKRVFDVLTQLGLLDAADTVIGDTEGRHRGISGGERRRVSIGLELLAAPAILIADEPTSGLDSVSAMRVVDVLKGLARSEGNNTTIITTIHQPNSQIFHLFDSVLVLGRGGRQVFFGEASDVVSHYAAIGRPCPPGWNPADFVLEIATDSSPELTPVSTARPGSRPNFGLAKRVIGSRPSSSEKPFISPTAGHSFDEESAKETGDQVPTLPFPPSAEISTKPVYTKPATVLLTQFQVLAGRQIRNLKRDWSLVVMHNAVTTIMGLLVGGLYYKVNTSIGGFQSRIGCLFFLGSLISFASLSALSNFSGVKPLFLRERANSYYSPFAFFLSQVFFDIVPLRIIPTVVMGSIAYWMVGLSPTAAHFFKFILILVEFNVATTLFNLLLAAAIRDGGVAILTSAIVNLFQMAFAGFFVNLSSVPPVLRWLQYLSPLKFMLEALSVNEVSSGLMINDTLEGVKVQTSASLIMGILFGFVPTAYYRDVLVLFAFIGGFALLLIYTVVFRLREIR